MRKNKLRHQKYINEKFSETKIYDKNNIYLIIQNYLKKCPELERKFENKITNNDLKNLLTKLNLYNGTFYVSLPLFSKLTNTDEIKLQTVKINQKNNEAPYFDKNCKNCFVKVFIVGYKKGNKCYNDKLTIAFLYRDWGYQFEILEINTEYLYLENNVLKSMLY